MIGLVLVAAGSGQRLGAGVPKALVRVAGRSMIEHRLRTVSQVDRIGQVVVVALQDAPTTCVDRRDTRGVRVVAGGASRDASVRHGLGVLDAGTQFVLIHDAARPFARRRCSSGCSTHWSPDRTRHPGHARHRHHQGRPRRCVHNTPVRDELVAVQTPQGFLDILRMRTPLDVRVTDDAMLVERAGSRCTWSTDPNGRSKSPPDLTCVSPSPSWHNRILSSAVRWPSTRQFRRTPCLRWWVSAPMCTRSTQVPRAGRGLFWPGEVGLAGHSDGDVVAHACADAVLNACGLGDLGGLIGTDRAEYRGASGAEILRAVAVHARKQGFDLVNIGVQMIGNRPRIGPRVDWRHKRCWGRGRMPGSRIGHDHRRTGLTGRSEGLAAMATALVTRSR